MSMICCSFCLPVNCGIDTIIHVVVSKKQKPFISNYWKVEAKLNMKNINTRFIWIGDSNHGFKYGHNEWILLRGVIIEV